MKNYKITVLRGDGIGPEIVNECIKVLDKAGEKFGFSFDYNDQLLGGCAIDATGVPYPAETAAACKASDAVLLGAVGGLSGTTSRAAIDRKRVCWPFVRTWVCLPTCARPRSLPR